MTSPDQLPDNDRASLGAILAASPELAAVTTSVRAFAAIMNEKRGRKLVEPWMTAAEATGEPALKSFVTGLSADQVTAEVGGRLLARGLVTTAKAYLEYSETDPYAVWARFRAGTPGCTAGVDFECAFARDLLSAGLDVVSGTGDVRVRPGRGRTVVIELFTPAGTDRFTTPAAGVKRFLAAARALVPPGAEAGRLGLDARIAAILGGGGSR
jgi:hypothetical protein